METANTVPVEDEKLGLTLSRLALGLCVRSVERGSEAWCAGVLPYSVLVAINDFCLLAEPSKQALELRKPIEVPIDMFGIEINVLIFDGRSAWGPPRTLSLRISEASILLDDTGSNSNKTKKNNETADSAGENGDDDNNNDDDHVDDNKVDDDNDIYDNGKVQYEREAGFCWVDLSPIWNDGATAAGVGGIPSCSSSLRTSPGEVTTTTDENGVTTTSTTVSCHAQVWAPDAFCEFDEHGELPDSSLYGIAPSERLEIEITVTTTIFKMSSTDTAISPKRCLLYKHDDDIRQEMFATEFVKTCDNILKSCGLDLKLITFSCIAVGEKRGFIEWIQGSVPLSEICQPASEQFAGSILGRRKERLSMGTTTTVNSTANSNTNCNNNLEMDTNPSDEENPRSSVAKAGLTKYDSLRRLRSDAHNGASAMTTATSVSRDGGATTTTIIANNPIQDFLRSFAYGPDDPYMIRKEVMDAYVKSCAGYCVITYILGVGDRHLDNLLLHQSGHFFHCDYSFILGNDPKKYLPVRVTEDMINGMGGRDSDNFAIFMSLSCAAFLTLRRPENVRHLLSFVRSMEGSSMPDITINQTMDVAILGIRQRLKLELSDDEAISYMEKLIEESSSSRIWMAVDAMHSLGKHF